MTKKVGPAKQSKLWWQKNDITNSIQKSLVHHSPPTKFFKKNYKKQSAFHLLLNKNLNLKNELRVVLGKNQRVPISLWERVVYFSKHSVKIILISALTSITVKKQEKKLKEQIHKNRKRCLIEFECHS